MPMTAPGNVTPITASTRFPVSRRGPALSRKDDAAHARALGEVLHAWNRAHAALFMVFARVSTNNDFSLALAIWQTGSGDKAQRQLLDAAANVALQDRRALLHAVRWALAVMGEIGTYRNDIAHSEMTFYYTELIPGMTVKESAAERLSRRRLDTNWRALRGDLHAIAHYLAHLDATLMLNMPRPLSKRPRLQFVHSSSAQNQATRRRAKKAAQQRQREASRQ